MPVEYPEQIEACYGPKKQRHFHKKRPKKFFILNSGQKKPSFLKNVHVSLLLAKNFHENNMPCFLLLIASAEKRVSGANRPFFIGRISRNFGLVQDKSPVCFLQTETRCRISSGSPGHFPLVESHGVLVWFKRNRPFASSNQKRAAGSHPDLLAIFHWSNLMEFWFGSRQIFYLLPPNRDARPELIRTNQSPAPMP